MTDSNITVDKASSAISFDVSNFYDILMAGTAAVPPKHIESTSDLSFEIYSNEIGLLSTNRDSLAVAIAIRRCATKTDRIGFRTGHIPEMPYAPFRAHILLFYYLQNDDTILPGQPQCECHN